MTDRIGRHVKVHGLVQGVFFRDTCRREAASAGVDGWVSNEPDGTVEAVFIGRDEAVQRMVDWCRHGSRPSRVERVEVTDLDPVPDASGFAVR